MGDKISLPETGLERTVKGIQIYRRETKKVSKGDRMAVLVPALNAENIERCVMTSPNSLTSSNVFFASFSQVKHFKGGVKSKSKFHISINHINVMGELTLLCSFDQENSVNSKCIVGMKTLRTQEIEFGKVNFDLNQNFEYVEEISQNGMVKFTKGEKHLQDLENEGRCLILLVKLSKSVFIRENSFFIGSRMDFHEESKNCRIAFFGHSIKILKKDLEVGQEIF